MGPWAYGARTQIQTPTQSQTTVALGSQYAKDEDLPCVSWPGCESYRSLPRDPPGDCATKPPGPATPPMYDFQITSLALALLLLRIILLIIRMCRPAQDRVLGVLAHRSCRCTSPGRQ